MTQPPLISVVIPLYNNEVSIVRAIESVLKQDFKEGVELLVVDDGSTDLGASKVSRMENFKIRLIRQINAGVSAARNRGICEAKGEFIAFLDSDDEWRPNFLSTIWRLIQDFPDGGAYATSYLLKYPDGKTIEADINGSLCGSRGGLIEDYFACAASGNGPLWSSAVCVPKRIFDDLGGFPEETSMQEDLQMWVKIVLSYPVVFSPLPASIYYKETINSLCRTVVPKRRDMIFADTINTAISNSIIVGERAISARRYVNKYAFQNGFKAIVANDIGEAQEILALVYPFNVKDNLRMFFLKLLSLVPDHTRQKIWKTGKWLKSKAR